MKKVTFAAITCILALFLVVPVQAKTTINFGEYSTEDGDFEAKFWKEKFKGGGPGQPGNVLMAVGEGFVLQNAMLVCTVVDTGAFDWVTLYEGGELTLNSQGPWLDKGKLRATDVIAVNRSIYFPLTGELQFNLSICGTFDSGELFWIEAEYWDSPNFKYSGPELSLDLSNVVFQRGFGDQDFNILIGIDSSGSCPIIKPFCGK